MEYTKESLQKTWGLVESKEHADYISEQCKSVGIISSDTWRCEYGYFSISLNELLFWGDERHANSKGKKQITITPLPPKASGAENKISYTIKKGIQAKSGCEDFELTGVDSIGCAATVSVSFNDSDEIINIECENLPPKAKTENTDFSKPPKHFDCICNKRGGKCCIGNCDTWPKVGDEIVTRGGGNGILMISKPDKDNMVVCNFYGEYALVYFDELQKPKSKQDLLIEDLHQKLLTNNCKDYYLLACDIVQGKIKGVSYNP